MNPICIPSNKDIASKKKDAKILPKALDKTRFPHSVFRKEIVKKFLFLLSKRRRRGLCHVTHNYTT